MKWPDLSRYAARLTALEFPDKKIRLVLMGLTPGSDLWQRAIAELDFHVARSGRALVRENASLSLRDVKAIFTLAIIRDMERKEIVMPAPGSQEEKREESSLRSAVPVGKNFQGHEVFDGEAGRFVRAENMSEADSKDSAVFLRYDGTPESLAKCANGFVEEMANGRIMKFADLRKFAGAVFDVPELDVFDQRLRVIQEAVEAAVQRRVEAGANAPDEEAFRLAVALYDAQPAFEARTSESVELQQYSTPPPMAIVAQRLLGDTAGKAVLEPTAGNLSLVSVISPEAEIYGTELDPQRIAQLTSAPARGNIQITEADATRVNFGLLRDGDENQFDLVIANPPFGGLRPAQIIDELNVTRLDHLILMRSLAARKDNGRAVYILAADYDNKYPGKAGQISGGSKNLLNWLADHYVIEDAIEINGKLYEKQGASCPVRMLTIGRRRTQEEARRLLKTKEARLGDTMPVLMTWDEVWSHAAEVVHRLDHTEPETAAPALQDNSYQTPYITLASSVEPESMVPRNLLGPSQEALGRLARHIEAIGYDTVEGYLAYMLRADGFTPEHIAKVFSAEQIDALALSIYNDDITGRGFVNGDMTGLGKGRVLAGLAVYSVSKGVPVIFLTEKPNLFSDFWRDISDICEGAVEPKEIFTPFIMNATVDIKDINNGNRRVFPATSPSDRARMLEHEGRGAIKENGYNIVFATYTQFNRSSAKSAKAGWLPAAALGSSLILDESHNAAGDSNIAKNIAAAVANADACAYSSATFAKAAGAIVAYSKIFPPAICNDSLADTLRVGGETLQEIMAAMLVADGVLVRREHDLSGLEFEVVEDSINLARNEVLSDKLSNVLLSMSHLSGDVENMASAMNRKMERLLEKLPEASRKGKRLALSSTNFGSRLYTIIRQFLLAITVDAAVEHGVRAIKEGRKPVFVLEQTMETMLRETLSGDILMEPGDEEDADPATFDFSALYGQTVDGLTFRHLLHRVLDKILIVTERSDYGTVNRRPAISLVEDEEERENFKNYVKALWVEIDEFPDLPVSPLDTIISKIEDAGFTCGEISGRSLGVKPIGNEGKMTVVSVTTNRLQTIHRFNNGELDGVILTRAGSTGLSLHSSEKFQDQRQRQLIEVQIPNNVAERIQFFGRVKRKGEVIPPGIKTISSGLPCQARPLAMQNAKLRKLSANTQSNRQNAAEIEDIPDILNTVGNRLAFDFLCNNPEIARTLNINLDVEEGSHASMDECWFITKLTGRISLLPIVEQKRIYDELTSEFQAFIRDADSKGVNPFKSKVLDYKAKVVDRSLYSGVEQTHYQSEFDRPVFISTLEWEEVLSPVRATGLAAMVSAGEMNLLEDRRVSRPLHPTEIHRFDVSAMIEAVNDRFESIMETTLTTMGKDFETIREALNHKDHNAIKSANAKRMAIIETLRDILPGNVIEFSTGPGELARGVVTSVVYPPSGKEHLAGQYAVKIQRPGVENLDLLSFNMLIADGYSKEHYLDSTFTPAETVFNSAPSGKVTMNRTILDGNLFKAAQIASSSGLGRAAVFTDENGVNRRAIMLYHGVTMRDLMDKPVRIDNAAIASRLILDDRQVQLSTDPDFYRETAAIIRNRGADFTLTVTGTKINGGKFFTSRDLKEVVGSFSGSRASMRAIFPPAKLPETLSILAQMGCAFYVPPDYRDKVNTLEAQQMEERQRARQRERKEPAPKMVA
jgi:hypothetical protein